VCQHAINQQLGMGLVVGTLINQRKSMLISLVLDRREPAKNLRAIAGGSDLAESRRNFASTGSRVWASDFSAFLATPCLSSQESVESAMQTGPSAPMIQFHFLQPLADEHAYTSAGMALRERNV
jgi:hypothetical protein